MSDLRKLADLLATFDRCERDRQPITPSMWDALRSLARKAADALATVTRERDEARATVTQLRADLAYQDFRHGTRAEQEAIDAKMAAELRATVANERREESDWRACRLEVRRFASRMEAKLRINDAKKGRSGWKGCTATYLRTRARNELKEVDSAHKALIYTPTPAARSALTDECADVANMCMMLADVAGDLMTDTALAGAKS